jgi:hypothetical protein
MWSTSRTAAIHSAWQATELVFVQRTVSHTEARERISYADITSWGHVHRSASHHDDLRVEFTDTTPWTKFHYNSITPTKSPPFCMTTFTASLTNLTSLLPHSRDCRRYVSDQYWHLHRSDCRNILIYAHTTLRTVLTCDISLGSLTLPASEAGDFVELILLYTMPVLVVFNECCRVLKSTANLVLEVTREGMRIRLVRSFR